MIPDNDITGNKNPRSVMSYSSPCQLLDFSFQLLPPSLPLLPVRAAGLRDGKSVSCVTVEVYSTGSPQWYTANPLPALYFWMTSVTTAGTCYLLGGLDADAKDATTVVYSSVPSLIQGVTSPTHQSASRTSILFTLGNIPVC